MASFNTTVRQSTEMF